MRELSIRSVRLPKETAEETVALLGKEFPDLAVERSGATVRGDAVLSLAAWTRSTSFTPFDDAIERAITHRVVLDGEPHLARHALEILTRYQRYLERPSQDALFDRVVAAHRALHPIDKPLVRADYDHALDTWRWLLRLAPAPSPALQLAALFHDVERLESEADARIEQRARHYLEFKEKHAHRGSEIAFDVLLNAGVDRPTAARTRDLIAQHERRTEDKDLALLNDADGLSFFSLNSAGYFDYFGALQTRRKISYTLARIGRGARFRLAEIRLRPDVETLFGAVFRA